MIASLALGLFGYLFMVFLTRVIYEAGIDEKEIPRWSWGDRKDDSRIFLPIFWPLGLPLIAGNFVGKVMRKGLEIINSDEK